MRVLSLDLENIGPFDEAHLEFAADEPAVTFVTGENGTGKSIVLDAIRGLFGSHYASLERQIWRTGVRFRLDMSVEVGTGTAYNVSADSGAGAPESGFVFGVPPTLPQIAIQTAQGVPSACPPWIVDFWRSDLAHDNWDIKALTPPDTRKFLLASLQGKYRNAAATEWITFVDYLRGSHNVWEKRVGDLLFETIRKVVQVSLLDGGELSHVERTTLTPIIRQSGQEVPLRNLSSGNAYLIQRLLSLLGKMYAVHALRQTPPETLSMTPGLLLIDEAENHLHPRWQKRLITDILSIFPNLQIIATTHSPFLLASVAGAKVYVCRYERERQTCVIEDASDRYVNQPIDEILVSPAFDYTQPFSDEITRLLEGRKAAIGRGDEGERRRIEAELLARNPQHFAYFEIDEKLRMIAGGSR